MHTEPEFVNVSGARNRFWNRFLGSLNVYNFGLRTSKRRKNEILRCGKKLFVGTREEERVFHTKNRFQTASFKIWLAK
jgi:hypothetical protein